jgi:hypothetical protein
MRRQKVSREEDRRSVMPDAHADTTQTNAQKSTLHLNRGSLTGAPRPSNGTRTGSTLPSLSHFSLEILNPLPAHDAFWLSVRASSVSLGGSRILASTSGAETKRLFSKSRGDTRSCRQFRLETSDEDRGARGFKRYGIESEDWVE